MFSFRSFIILGLIYRLMMHFELFLYVVRWRSEFFPFFLVYSHAIEPAQLTEKIIFSPMNYFCMFVKNQLSVRLWNCFYSVPLSYLSMFTPMSRCFDSCSFLRYLKSGNVGPAAWMSFFPPSCFCYSRSLAFTHEF